MGMKSVQIRFRFLFSRVCRSEEKNSDGSASIGMRQSSSSKMSQTTKCIGLLILQ